MYGYLYMCIYIYVYLYTYMSMASGGHLGTLTLLHWVVEAYLAFLASTKQVLDVKNIIRGPFSLVLVIFLSVSDIFKVFV